LRKLLFFDPDRRPREWTECVKPGEYLLFRADPESFELLDQDGVLVFDSLDKAREYAAEEAKRETRTVYEIFDHHGRAGDPIARYYARPRDAGAAKRSALWHISAGSALLAAAPFFIAYDVQHELRLVWGCLIGIKFSLLGTVSVTQGLLGLRGIRRAESLGKA
jgi:hypothetical protein